MSGESGCCDSWQLDPLPLNHQGVYDSSLIKWDSLKVSVDARSKWITAKSIVLWKINDMWASIKSSDDKSYEGLYRSCYHHMLLLRMRLAQGPSVSSRPELSCGSWRNFQPKSSPTLGARARLSWDLVLRELRREPWAPTNSRWVKHCADLQNYFKYLWGIPKKWQSQFQNHVIRKYMSYQKLWLWMKMRYYLNF